MSDPVLFAFTLNGPDKGLALSGDMISQALAAKDLAWVHLDAGNPLAGDWLFDALPYLDPHAVDALLASETRPRATEIGDGLLIFLRGINLNKGADAEDMVSVRVWVDSVRIITTSIRPLQSVKDIRDRVIDGRGPETPGHFLSLLAERLTLRMEPEVQDLDEATDALEESVMHGADPGLRGPISQIRGRTIRLRRYIAPQRDALANLRSSDMEWIDNLSHRRLAETTDKLTRIVEELDLARDRAQVVKDELTNALADRLNRNTYVLSVIAAIFLPLGFLTGLFGINLGGIPGSDNPWAFVIFSGLLVVIVALQVVVFRLLKWF